MGTLNTTKTLSRRLPFALFLHVREKLDEFRHINNKYLRIDSVLLAVHKRNHSNRNVKCINDVRICLGHESLDSCLLICDPVMCVFFIESSCRFANITQCRRQMKEIQLWSIYGMSLAGENRST
jgi:hypothetical protein